MREERAEYIRCVQEADWDKAGQKRAKAAIEASDVYAHGKPVPFSFVPYLFNADDLAFFEEVAAKTVSILEKLIRRYLDDPGYRALFHFPPEIERLILLPCGYDRLLPLARIDLFLDEADRSFKFCEFNADGAAGMSRDRAIAAELARTDSFARFSALHDSVEPFELLDTWVQAFSRVYASDPLSAERPAPTVAITDFRESAVMSDFDAFVGAFARAGIKARFVDTRSFSFDGQALRDATGGTRIDAVYRRAVTSEILEHLDECSALIDAVAAQAVCLVGHFRTNVVHSKMVNVALFDESRADVLDPDEIAFVDAHVCRTKRLLSDGSCDIAAVKAGRERWIVKPADDYGARGVFAGVDFDDATWTRIVDEHLDAGFIVQEFYPPRHVDIVVAGADADGKHADTGTDAGTGIDAGGCRVESWESMPGFYLYDGQLAGFYCRLGRGGVIAVGEAGGLVAPSFAVDLV